MSTQNYQMLLRDLEARKNVLKGRLEEIEDLEASIRMLLDPSLSVVNTNHPLKKSTKKQVNTLADEVFKILEEANKNCSVQEICEALKQKDIHSNAKDLAKTLSGALHRAAKDKESGIVNIGRGIWGLSKWSE